MTQRRLFVSKGECWRRSAEVGTLTRALEQIETRILLYR